MFGRHLLRGTRLRSSPAIRSQLYRTKSKETRDSDEIIVPKKPTVIITPGSDQHNDLPSFLQFASRQNLSPTSTVHVGTHYEYTVASALRSLGFSLTRTGRTSDFGIDLLGHWEVPSAQAPTRVLLQCKASNKALTPANVRELEGAFSGAPAGWKGTGVFGFLATTSQATKGMRDALIRSPLPMGFLQVTGEGKVLQFIWNHVATQSGLEGVGVTTRYMLGCEGKEVEEEVALTWNGWTITKKQQEIEAAAIVPVEKEEFEASGEVAVKRGRPRKIEQPQRKSRGRPPKISIEPRAEGKKTTVKTKTTKKTQSPKIVTKSKKDLKVTRKGQKKKG
jgi:hypothetical protein